MRIQIKIGGVYRLVVSKTMEFPATTAWAVVGQKVTVVGECKDNEEFDDPENCIYMIEWASDSFSGSGYRFPVRASQLTE